jgi:hypothetical protein
MYRTFWVVRCIFNSIHCGRLKSLLGLGQFVHTLIIGVRRGREPLCVAGLTGTI